MSGTLPASGSPRATRRAVAQLHPLTYGQRGLWFVEQLETGTRAYNDGVSARLRGDLDIDVLARSLCLLAARHEPLRSVFKSEQGEPVQEVQEQWTGRLVVAHAEDAADRDTAALSFAEEVLARPFNLTVGPVFRADLLRFATDDFVLVLGMHHLVNDGWSVGILLRELSAIYTALIKQVDPDLEPLLMRYADFAIWQHRHLTEDVLAGSLDYWLKHVDVAQTRLDTVMGGG